MSMEVLGSANDQDTMTGIGQVGFADALYGYLLPFTGTTVWRFDQEPSAMDAMGEWQETFKTVTSFDLSAASAAWLGKQAVCSTEASCQSFAGGFSASDSSLKHAIASHS